MKKYLFISLLFTLMSCTAYKDVPYFQNAATYDSSVSAGLPDIAIKPKDMLTIFVTSTDEIAVAQVNDHFSVRSFKI
jgi:hypothetical protein